jgi:AcrR family transcriptional regulator
VSQPTTRERILEVASELFIDRGYEATSLREIAERLGFTKAALYYHFQSKEQILAALVEPAQGIVRELVKRLEEADGVVGWSEAVHWLIGEIFANLAFFRLMDRNRTALDHIDMRDAILDEHVDLHERIEAAARAKGADLREQVRMITAIGAVTGFDDWAPGLLTETPADELRVELTAAVDDLLGTRRRGRSARR